MVSFPLTTATEAPATFSALMGVPTIASIFAGMFSWPKAWMQEKSRQKAVPKTKRFRFMIFELNVLVRASKIALNETVNENSEIGNAFVDFFSAHTCFFDKPLQNKRRIFLSRSQLYVSLGNAVEAICSVFEVALNPFKSLFCRHQSSLLRYIVGCQPQSKQ